MKINVLLAVLLIIYALIMILTWYLAYYKKKDYDIRCTKKTKGKVIKYSAVKYNEINIPLVEYEVNGVRYRVIGPKFKGAITKYVSTPLGNVESKVESNITTRDNLPDIIKISVVKNSIVSVTTNPLKELYPIDSDVDVYYDPEKPSVAYVQRFIQPSKFAFMMLFFGILAIVVALILLVK